jgi:hypothetical protein
MRNLARRWLGAVLDLRRLGMSGAHAFLPPSGAAAWVACAMWPTMNRLYPQDDTPESMEGTAAHDVFAEFLAGRDVAVGASTINGVPVTREMLDGAELYVQTIDADLAKCGATRAELHVEERVAMPGIHPENWGTPDTWHYAANLRQLRIYDYKFGHDFVDEVRNWQLIDYAAGILPMLPGPVDLVVFVIVQPRNYDNAGHVRRWTIAPENLAPYWGRLQAAAAAAHEPQPLATPGDQCDHCPGAHACKPLQREGMRAATLSMRSAPSPLQPPALALELRTLQRAAKLLKARIGGLEAETFARLQRGESIPGYGLKPTYGREAWRVSVAEAIAIGRVLGHDISKPGVMTPKQARDLGMPEEVVASIAGADSKGLALVADDGAAAERAFGN